MSIADWLPALMFVLLLMLVFTSYPSAFVLGGRAVGAGRCRIVPVHGCTVIDRACTRRARD